MASAAPEPQQAKRRNPKPHDALFKAVFAQPEHAAALFREALAPSVSSAIDWQTLTPQPGSFVDPELADYHSDLLFTVQLDGSPALLYVLLEHQSTNHAIMPLRMLHYAAQVWLHYCRQHDLPMPVLISLVISHAPGGWTGPRTFFDLLEPDPNTIPGLASLVPNFSLTLLDLQHLSNEELKSRALAAFPKLALWLLRDARDADTLFANLDFWAATFREALATSRGIEAVSLLLRYIALVCNSLQRDEFRERIRNQLPEAEQAAMTLAEQLHQEGLEKGLRMALRKLLTLKFEAPPPEVEARIEQATKAEIEQWIERVLTAPDLASVFAV